MTDNSNVSVKAGESCTNRTAGSGRDVAAGKTPDEVSESLQFERLLSGVSARFVDISSDCVSKEIERALREVLEFFRLDRCIFLRGRQEDGIRLMHPDHLVCAPGVEPVPQHLDRQAIHPWLVEQARAHGIVNVTFGDVPAEAVTERRTMERFGFKSVMAVRLVARESDEYFIAGMSMHREGRHPDELALRLRLLAEVFVNALSRCRAEEELRLAELKYRTVAEFAHDWEYWTEPDGPFCYISPSCEAITGYQVQEFQDTPSLLHDIVLSEDQASWRKHHRECHSDEEPGRLELRILRRDGRVAWLEHVCRPVLGPDGEFLGVRASNRDVTDRKQAEAERNITVDVLKRASVARDLCELLHGTMPLLQQWSNCEAIGIRLREGDDFPYFQTTGFADEFVRAENRLCRMDDKGCPAHDSGGNPVLECMCGNVLSGLCDPRQPFFTENGSFWTNGHSELLATTSEGDLQGPLRGHCRTEGYESIALIPLRAAGETFGLLQFNDRREGVFSPVLIGLCERLAFNIASAIAHHQAASRLRDAHQEVRQLKDRLHAENVYLKDEIKSSHDFEDIVGNSEPLRITLSKIQHVANTDASVVVMGETGTGKELFARAIHARSRRKDRPLVKVNCAAIPAALIESELFGHVKGAFTGAISDKLGRFHLANGGTLFLDEVGELGVDLQSKLLRVLQEGEFERIGCTETTKVDVRIVAATNRDLHAAVKDKSFRPDLYYRLAVFPIEVPPLRLRRGDIPLLVWHFITQKNAGLGRAIDDVSQEAMTALVEYDWPGNVRELGNIVERAMILSPGKTLVLDEMLGAPVLTDRRARSSSSLEEVNRAHIVGVLEECNWTIKGSGQAAERLGLAPSTLRYRIKKLGIRLPPRRPRSDESRPNAPINGT